MGGDRSTSALIADLITDPAAKAVREAENGLRQITLALNVIRDFAKQSDKQFKLRPSLVLQLNNAALDGIHVLAGTYRNSPVTIGGSKHKPVEAFQVPEEVAHMCDYVNDSWQEHAVHLASYVLWKMNWIHPFADGNGRTARALSYIVLSLRTDGVLPGAITIPDMISANKTPYYNALEAADAAWERSKQVDVSEVETMLGDLLAKQLSSAFAEAVGNETQS